MNSEIQPVPTPVPQGEPVKYSVPWKPIDNWIGLLLLAVIYGGLLWLAVNSDRSRLVQSGLLVIVQLSFLLPLAIIFAWRKVSWKSLGFGKFDLATLGIGCGLLIAGYAFILLHNGILMLLGVETQGEQITQLFGNLSSPVWFFIVGAILAPLVEEMFFRGFLFQGFRARYGWVPGLLLSSAIFGIAHLDPVALVPTFILGCVLAYMYQRSNSIWPGVIFHTMINSLGLCAAYLATQYPNLIPS
jgi:membrane protease YdiL (CAAX protease family)